MSHRNTPLFSTTIALERVNNLLLEMNAEGLFATVLYGILDQASGEFRYTRAGHELPLILDLDRNVSFPEQGTGLPLVFSIIPHWRSAV